MPLAAAVEAVARAAAGEPWGGPAPAEGPECPPVDGFLLKLLAQVWLTFLGCVLSRHMQCIACLPKGSAYRGRGGMGANQVWLPAVPAPRSAARACARSASST